MKDWMKLFGVLMLLTIVSAALVLAEDDGTTQDVTTTSADATVASDDAADDTVSDADEVDPGVTPDSPFYGLENAWDRIRLAMTFNKAKRAEKALQIAEERLSELRVMAEQGKADHAEKARLRYEQFLNKSREAAEGIDSDENADGAKNAWRRIAGLQNAVEAHRDHLANVKERIEAALAKENITDEQKANLEAILDRVEQQTEDFEAKVEAKKDSVKTKFKVLSGKTDDEVDDEEAAIDEETGLTKARVERAKARVALAKAVLARARERVNAQKAAGEDVADLEAGLELADDEVAEAEAGINSNAKDAYKWADRVHEYGNEIAAIATRLRLAHQNGTFNETKDELQAAIRERYEAHKAEVE
ncbi:hypothetical protein JW711_00170 [Candidatus Woesearchaeota archaeon]|nr:hypothetical protein [Candidatus Woesearchaeota archaeon]